MELLTRITQNPKVLHGQPSIRNMRFSVTQLLQLLAAGMTFDEILEDYPFLVQEDIQACLMYAALLANSKTLIKLPS